LEPGLTSESGRFGGVRLDVLANEVGMSRSGLLALFQMVLLRDWPERY
jgi:hypothetical protein